MEWIAAWPLALLVLLFLAWGYGDAVADSQKLAERARDKLHTERMAAIEKGLPPPDTDFDDALLTFLADGGARADPSGSRQRGRALGWAMLLMSSGLGWFLTCTLIAPDGPIGWLYHARAFGILPGLIGLGVLLHVRLTRTRD